MERILFAEGPRQLEVELSGCAADGVDGRPGSGRSGSSTPLRWISDQRIGGLVLDMARVHGPEQTAEGDWAFLASGDSLQVVLEDPDRGPAGDARGVPRRGPGSTSGSCSGPP